MAENSTPQSQSHAADASSETTFTRLMDGLKESVNEFQKHMTPENFARIVSALGAMGYSGATLMRFGAKFVRRHPVQVALGAALIFYALKGLLADNDRQVSDRESLLH